MCSVVGRWPLRDGRRDLRALIPLARATHSHPFTTDNFMALSLFLCRSIRPPRIIIPAPIAGSGVMRCVVVEGLGLGLLQNSNT